MTFEVYECFMNDIYVLSEKEKKRRKRKKKEENPIICLNTQSEGRAGKECVEKESCDSITNFSLVFIALSVIQHLFGVCSVPGA